MPSLHSFNTCWGNRKVSNFQGEQTFDDWLSFYSQEKEIETCARTFVPSYGYYGYQRVNKESEKEEDNVMEVDLENSHVGHSNKDSRKRTSAEQLSVNHMKKLRVSGTKE